MKPLGKQIKYTSIDPDFKARDIKFAMDSLSYAGVIQRVFASNAAGLPLSATINEKKFKLLFLDVGLVSKLTGVAPHMLQEGIHLMNKGSLAEQFVGQELLAYQNPYDKAEIVYWARDKVGSQAEVDYLFTHGNTIIPVEVKAGSTGRLKSLHNLMTEKPLPIGIHVSHQPLALKGKILSTPFYMIGELDRLLRDLI